MVQKKGREASQDEIRAGIAKGPKFVFTQLENELRGDDDKDEDESDEKDEWLMDPSSIARASREGIQLSGSIEQEEDEGEPSEPVMRRTRTSAHLPQLLSNNTIACASAATPPRPARNSPTFSARRNTPMRKSQLSTSGGSRKKNRSLSDESFQQSGASRYQ